jgi:hypothetical protein
MASETKSRELGRLLPVARRTPRQQVLAPAPAAGGWRFFSSENDHNEAPLGPYTYTYTPERSFLSATQAAIAAGLEQAAAMLTLYH